MKKTSIILFILISLCVFTSCSRIPVLYSQPDETFPESGGLSGQADIPGGEEYDASEILSDSELDGDLGSSDGEEDALTDQEFAEMDAVDDAIQEIIQTDGFEDMDIEEKSEKVLALLNELAVNGTEDFPYPLIKQESIYFDGSDMITFQYACGVLGGVKLKPFDPMLN